MDQVKMFDESTHIAESLWMWLYATYKCTHWMTFDRLIRGTPMVTAAIKLKDTCSLERKLWQTSVQFSSVAQSCPTFCDPMNRSMPGLPVHHQVPESTQINVHWVSDAIQPSDPLSSPSSTALNFSQHQGLFQWVLLIRWPKYWSFSFNINPCSEHPGLISLGWIGWISLQPKGFSRVFSNTTVQKHQFFGVQLSL